MTEVKNPIKTWWLKTHGNIDVCGDGKGRYSLEYLPDYAAVEFREGLIRIFSSEIDKCRSEWAGRDGDD